MDGLVLDLRGNGGGVLEEVIRIAGLFLKSAPIAIEVGSSVERVSIHADTDGESSFDGHL